MKSKENNILRQKKKKDGLMEAADYDCWMRLLMNVAVAAKEKGVLNDWADSVYDIAEADIDDRSRYSEVQRSSVSALDPI